MEGPPVSFGSIGRWLRLLLGCVGMALLLGAVTTLGYVHNVRWDLSPGNRFTLSDHAHGVLRDLDEPIRITGFIRTEDARNVVLKDLLWQASKESKFISYDIVDVNRNPTLASKLGVDAYGATVVESASRRADFSLPNEQSLISAIVHVTRPPKRVFSLIGHGECSILDTDRNTGCSSLRTALSRELYDVEDLSLFDGKDVPSDADLIMALGPKRELTGPEIASLGRYVNKGGRLLLFVDPFSAPRLTGLLAENGIKLGDDVILDTDYRLAGGEPFTAALPDRNESHAITANLDAPPLFSAYRSITARADEDKGERYAWLVRSGPNSWASHDPEVLSGKRAQFVAGRDVNGPLTAGLEYVKTLAGIGGRRTVRLVVFGDSDFVTNRFLDYLGNRDLVLNAANWLAREERLIASRPRDKQPGVNVFFVSNTDKNTLFRTAVVLQPALFLGIGLIVFVWRRWSA